MLRLKHLQVLLHDSNEVPTMQERGLLVNPSFLSRIAVTAHYVSKQGANYKKILRLSYDVIITYDNRKSNLR